MFWLPVFCCRCLLLGTMLVTLSTVFDSPHHSEPLSLAPIVATAIAASDLYHLADQSPFSPPIFCRAIDWTLADRTTVTFPSLSSVDLHLWQPQPHYCCRFVMTSTVDSISQFTCARSRVGMLVFIDQTRLSWICSTHPVLLVRLSWLHLLDSPSSLGSP